MAHGRVVNSLKMLSLHIEDAVPIKPPTPSSLILIDLPSSRDPGNKHRSPKETLGQTVPQAKDEETFVKQCLAASGSIYCRQAKTYPRLFLWRVINEGHLLQIQSADTARSASDRKEAHLTLSLSFQNSILPAGVAFADTDRGDALFVFAVTASKELYTLSLNTSFFKSVDSIPENVQEWCSVQSPSSFTIDRPHILRANHPYELFISFESGRLQRLTRKADEQHWTQENYDERSWGSSLRGMVSRKGNKTISYQSRYLDPSTAHAITASSDSTHVFTVCLNHTIRVWNLTTGRLVVSKDLLDKPRHPSESIFMNPAEPGHIQLIKLDHLNHPILATYSPEEGGQFKFWDVKGGLTSPLVLEDRYPGVKLNAPDPDPSGNTIWSLTSFSINPGDDSQRSEMWVLWRNNNYHRLYSLHFDFFDLPKSWETNWAQAVAPLSMKTAVPDLLKSDIQDITSKWLDFLFNSQQYSTLVLETALVIYQEATSQQLTASQKKTALVERLCSVIAGNVTLRKYSETEMDYHRFVADTDYQWRNYWRIIESINESRRAPMSLTVDIFSGMVWLVMADYCCAVRECSLLELAQHNRGSGLDLLEETIGERWPHRRLLTNSSEPIWRISALLHTAASFRSSFSAELMIDVEQAIEEEILTENEMSVSFRLNDFYERVNFGDQVTNEAFDELGQNLARLEGVDDDIFFAILELLPRKAQVAQSALRNTLFASDMLAVGLKNVIEGRRQILVDLIALIVFLEGEMRNEENDLSHFDGAAVFDQVLSHLKEYQRNLWLVSHYRTTPLEFLGSETVSKNSMKGDQLSLENARIITILEDSISKAIRPQPIVEKPQAWLLTEMLAEIEAWVNGQDEISPEDIAVFVQCDLIVHGDIELASQFERFQPRTAWAIYVRARLAIARREYSNAAIYFRKAAYSLACGKATGSLHEMSAGLISLIDMDCFFHGLPRYYQHIVSLFEAVKAFCQAAEFARLALQSLPPDQKEPVPNFRSEILSRLFTAEIQNSRFLPAYQALTQFTDIALQKSSVISLVNAIFDPRSSLSDLAGSLRIFTSLPLALYPRLAQHVDQFLIEQAKKQSLTSAKLSNQAARSSRTSNIDHQSILIALHLLQNNFRAALPILFEQIKVLRKSTRWGYHRRGNDPQTTELRHAYLTLINALCCVAPDEAYILVEVDEAPPPPEDDAVMDDVDANASVSTGKRKRVIFTLADLRKEYQHLLDLCSRLDRGDFAFDSVMDDEEEEGEDEMLT